MYTLKSDAGHIERMTSLPAFATQQQDVYIWSRGDGLQHLQWNVSLQVLWLGDMQIWWLPWRWFVIGTGEICIFNLLHVAYIAKWVIFCVHGNRTTNIFFWVYWSAYVWPCFVEQSCFASNCPFGHYKFTSLALFCLRFWGLKCVCLPLTCTAAGKHI